MYFNELKKSMNFLGKKNKSIFIGQAVVEPGTFMSNTLNQVPKNKKIEMPVAEEMQLGMSLGLAMDGNIPISIIPRWNFILNGMNQLVNHIDKYFLMGNNKLNNIIIRTGVGADKPLNPQHQHIGDFSDSIQKMCKNINLVKLKKSYQIFPAYKKAFTRKDKKVTILVEYGNLYNR
tara:strand:- start:5851 stop:6378 length:528 start_codon:yes stop_codon:yes gene_type:complete